MRKKINIAYIYFLTTALASIVFSAQNFVEAAESQENRPTLSYGDTGSTVIDLQYKLKEHGYYPYAVDGHFGEYTKAAVLRFQSNYDLVPDGIAGTKTLIHLYELHENVREVSYAVDPQLIHIAHQFIGVPYVWGGTTPKGFDCSGFIKYVFARKGIHIPRTVKEIWSHAIDVTHPSIGDVVFFETSKKGPSHAGIYIGKGEFIHAGTSSGVKISKLTSSYWKDKYLGSKRIVQVE